MNIGIDYSKGEDEATLAVRLGDEIYIYKGKEAKILIEALHSNWRCNICGELVQFDGTKPTLKVKL